MQRNRNGHAHHPSRAERVPAKSPRGNADEIEAAKRRRCGRQVPDFATRMLEPEDPFDADEEIARYLASKREEWGE